MTSDGSHGLSPAWHHTRPEEIANSLTSALGAVLGVVALVLLCVLAARYGDAWYVASCAVYGGALATSYGVSAVYHALPLSRAKAVLRLIDHSAIFVLIAGTYTPFLLVSLRGPWGWSLFGVVWGLAALGIVLKLSPLRGHERLSIPLYLGLGWVAVVAIGPLMDAVGPTAMALLLAGGVSYSAGVGFYLWRTLPFRHAVWHVFVLGGSVCHFLAVVIAVIPSAV